MLLVVGAEQRRFEVRYPRRLAAGGKKGKKDCFMNETGMMRTPRRSISKQFVKIDILRQTIGSFDFISFFLNGIVCNFLTCSLRCDWLTGKGGGAEHYFPRFKRLCLDLSVDKDLFIDRRN